MYSALTYFGGGTLVCTTSAPDTDNGKTVAVVGGGRSWSGTIADGSVTFKNLPCKNKYTVSLINGSDTEYTTEVIFDYGQYKEIDVGLDATTWKGLKAIVNAGLESSLLAVGDQISASVNGETQVFDILHIDYRSSKYGNNIIVGKHTCLSAGRQMRTSNTNAGGYAATLVASYLDGEYYNSLPDDMRTAITEMTFQASVGNQSTNLQNETHKIWIPLEWNIFGAQTFAALTERNTGGAEQFSYFATAANRVKTLGDTGSACTWWEGSPTTSYSTTFCGVDTAGSANYYGASGSIGVLPCFMIAAD